MSRNLKARNKVKSKIRIRASKAEQVTNSVTKIYGYCFLATLKNYRSNLAVHQLNAKKNRKAKCYSRCVKDGEDKALFLLLSRAGLPGLESLK